MKTKENERVMECEQMKGEETSTRRFGRINGVKEENIVEGLEKLEAKVNAEQC